MSGCSTCALLARIDNIASQNAVVVMREFSQLHRVLSASKRKAVSVCAAEAIKRLLIPPVFDDVLIQSYRIDT
jgi:pantoate kinase